MAIIDELNNLGDAVRERSGLTDKMTMSQMADVVRNIPEPDLSPYATIEYVDEQIAGIDVSGVDLSDYSTTEQMNEAIKANNYKIGQGLFHNLDNNVIGVRAKGALVFDNSGVLNINQNNLYTKDSSYYVISGSINIVPSGKMVVFNLPLRQTVEDTEAWLANVSAKGEPLFLGLTAGGYGIGGTINPVIEQNAVAVNGETYDYVINMSALIGPNVMSSTGMNSIYVCYRGGNFTIIIMRDETINLGAITYLDFGIRNINYSLAHYWIGNRNHFRTFNNNGTLIFELNEGYLNGLIDNKLSGIAKAEEVSV